MAYSRAAAVVLEKEAIAKHIFRVVVACKDIAKEAHPGQFVHILPKGFPLRRPISICEIHREKGALTLVFEVKGEGTAALSGVTVGENMDILGPLGHGFTLLPDAKHVVLTGGGIGVPPMLTLAQIYKKRASVICGFRSATAAILQDAFRTCTKDVVLCTDDGTAGRHGFVTEPLEEMLSVEKVDMLYACGPRLMLQGAAALAREYHVPSEVSIEERMGCGVGACLVCACELEQKGKRRMGLVCKDGPVFRGEEVVWQ